MKKPSLVVCGLFCVFLLWTTGCGGGGGGSAAPAAEGEGEGEGLACATNSDCNTNLLCVDSVCAYVDTNAYSDDLTMKSDGVSSSRPMSISPEAPGAGETVTATVTVSGASSIALTVTGDGCGAIANTTGASPLTAAGAAGTYGYCDLSAVATVGSTTETYQGHFEVAATDPNIPPVAVTDGVWMNKAFPAASGSSKPTISGISGPSGFMNGSTSSYTISYTGSESVTGVAVQIEGYTNGYYLLPATASGGTVSFDLDFANDYFIEVSADLSKGVYKEVSGSTLNLIVAIIDVLNQTSDSSTLSITGTESKYGDVKASITWDTICDVDLHVTEPNEHEIWYGDEGPSSTGGELDVDSNVGCVDNGSVENIYWPAGQSPQGEFGIRVHMYTSACLEDDGDITSTGVTLTYVGCGEEFVNGPITESFTLGTTGDQYTVDFSSLCSYTVSGTVKYEDFAVTDTGLSASGTMVPVRFADIKVLRAEDDEVLGEGSIDAAGEYEISFTNDGEAGYYVQVYASRDSGIFKQEVKNLTGELYAFRSEGTIDETVEPQKTGLDIEVKKADGAGAWNMWDVGLTCASYARLHGGSTPPELTWRWTSGEKPGGKEASYYVSANNEIYILGMASDSDEYDDVVLGHEYGHFVNHNYSTDDSPGGSHSSNNQSAPALSWSEGWATFFGTAALDRSSYADTNAAGMGVFYSIETLPAGKPLGNAGAALSGSLSEAVAASVLHDLFDSTNETKDTLGGKSTAIWTIFTTYLKSGYANFNDRGAAGRDLVDFLDGWFCLGYGDAGDSTGADADKNGVRGNVIGLHSLSYDFPTLASCK